MPQIMASTLKHYRNQRHLTQQSLHEKSKISLPTIKRIESRRVGATNVRQSVFHALSKALGLNGEELSKPPNVEPSERGGHRQLRILFDAETWLALQVVEHTYRISKRSQLLMAPLFAALLAEASLKWRNDRLEKMSKAVQELDAAGGSLGAIRAEGGIDIERQSIQALDILGKHKLDESDNIWSNETTNPFARFLQDLVSDISDSRIELMKWGKELEIKTPEGLPEYRIGTELIEELCQGNSEAVYALEAGYAQIKDIPETLLGEMKSDERVEWLIRKIPQEKLKQHQDKAASLQSVLQSIELAQDGGNV